MKTNPRVGSYYLIGAGTLMVIAWASLPLGYVLLWPILSLAIISLGYFKLGPMVYSKQNGQHPIWVKALHYFSFLGHELSRRAYAKQCAPWNRLLPNLLIGRQLKGREVELLRTEGVSAVLDLTAEFSEPPEIREMNYLNLPLLDLTAPTDKQLERALAFIQTHIKEGKVYVHCKIGYSRTAAISGSYLIQAGYAQSTEAAISKLKNARPPIIIRPEALATIQRYAKKCLQP